MNNMTDLLGAFKASRNIHTDVAMATALGVRKTAFSNYKNGVRRLPDVALIRIARETGEPLENVLAIANATAEATPPEEKEWWLSQIANLTADWRKR